MSVSGLCEICTTGEVNHTCDRCGMFVCDRHYDEDTGFCVECAGEVGRSDSRDRSREDDGPDGVDTYRF